MKRLIYTLAFLAFTLSSWAQTNSLSVGFIDTLHSRIFNETRTLWVYVPDHEAAGEHTRYPVLYLLDGNWHFTAVVGMTQQLSYVNGNSLCPEMIVVGIAHPDRYRDLTPSCDSTYSPTSGGNEQFINFLEKELIPHIDSHYPTEPYRMLIGHSLGGLTTLNVLIRPIRLFNAYVAIDPSVWWNNEEYLKEAEKALPRITFGPADLFVAVANTLRNGMDTLTVQTDTSPNTAHFRSKLKLVNLLRNDRPAGLQFHYKYYANDTHSSVPFIAMYDALRTIFSYYNLPLTRNDFNDTTLALPQKIEQHFRMISQKMGYAVRPSENFINTMGYNSLMRKNYVQAEYYFRLNVENYPRSFNAYDSYGDYYAQKGNKSKAIELYTKALSLKENPESRKKLNKLKTE
ncbi:MAG: hypothetical protein JXR71_01540 [Bacteroidales bacterium]|nr:hypothetical protein [Bacteroidales bacterium]